MYALGRVLNQWEMKSQQRLHILQRKIERSGQHFLQNSLAALGLVVFVGYWLVKMSLRFGLLFFEKPQIKRQIAPGHYEEVGCAHNVQR